MKRLLIALCFLGINAAAQDIQLPVQDGKVVYEIIVPAAKGGQAEVFARCRAWTAYVWRGKVIDAQSAEAGTISGRSSAQYIVRIQGADQTFYAKYSFAISCSESKAALRLTGITIGPDMSVEDWMKQRRTGVQQRHLYAADVALKGLLASFKNYLGNSEDSQLVPSRGNE